MMDARKIQYYTTAAWLRGYAARLDEYQDQQLIHKLTQAATMLECVFGKFSDDEVSDESNR